MGETKDKDQRKDTAFADPKVWCMYGFILSIQEKNIRKLYERYKAEHNIGYAISLSDTQRHEFEKAVMGLLCKKFKAVHNREFVYPGTYRDRLLVTELVKGLDVDSIKKR